MNGGHISHTSKVTIIWSLKSGTFRSDYGVWESSGGSSYGRPHWPKLRASSGCAKQAVTLRHRASLHLNPRLLATICMKMDKKAFSFRGLNSPHDPPTRGSAPGPRSGLCSARSPCPLPLSKSWIPPLWGACSIVLDVVYEEKINK